MTINDQSRKSLIQEYKKTQDMIRHYDDMIIRFGSMTQTGVLIFIGLAFGLLSKERMMFFLL
jgi:hypothetical protein